MRKFLVLCLMWFAWSGHYTLHEPLIAAFGAASCAGVYALSRRMERSYSATGKTLIGLRLLGYLPYLLGEIIKANLAVAKIVLSPTMPIQRQLIRVPTGLRSAGARVLYANSITLTPGTISLAVRDDYIRVHAIDDDAAAGVLSGEMNRRVRALEKGPPP